MTVPHAGSIYTGEYVAARLGEAGATLFALRVSGTRPAQMRCFWPEMPGAIVDAEGWVPPPTSRQITEMDEVFDWIKLIPVRDVHLRRLVNYRALTNPLTGDPIFSWRTLAEKFGVHHETVRRWGREGWMDIATALNRPLFCHRPAFAAGRRGQHGLAAVTRSHAAVSAQARRVLKSA